MEMIIKKILTRKRMKWISISAMARAVVQQQQQRHWRSRQNMKNPLVPVSILLEAQAQRRMGKFNCS